MDSIMEKFCKKWLKLLPFNHCKGLGDDSKEVTYALRLQLEKMHHHRRETWRDRPPKNPNHPLAIKRPSESKKRVTFKDVFRLKHEEHHSCPRTVQDIWRMHEEYKKMTDTEEIDTSNSTQAVICTENMTLNSVLIPESTFHVDESSLHCYENVNFFNEEMEKGRDRFVTAFGKKGKQIGEFEDAKDLVCLPDGSLIVTDMVLGRLQKFYNNASSVTLLGPEDVTHPWSVTLTQNQNIAVSLCKEKCVRVLSENGERILSFGEEHFQSPAGIACDKQGRFIVCDSKAGSVSMFDTDGSFIRYLGNPDKKEQCFSNPRYVCVSSINGDIIVADSGHHKVKIFTENGDFIKAFGSFGKEDGQFKCPYGVCTDDHGTIFVADHYNSRISMFTGDGLFVQHLVTHDHGLLHPQGIKIDPKMYMYVTHGHLKATEVAIFKLSNTINMLENEYREMVSHV